MLRVMGWRWGWSVRAAGKQSDGAGRGKDWKLIKPALALAPSLNHGPGTVTQVLRSPGGHYWGVSIAMVTWWCGKWDRSGDEDFVFMCQEGAKEKGLRCASWHDNLFPAKGPPAVSSCSHVLPARIKNLSGTANLIGFSSLQEAVCWSKQMTMKSAAICMQVICARVAVASRNPATTLLHFG